MTVREYIGARYVPLFVGNWSNTKSYEPLSVVLYQGNSYTSRQAVPKGISINNTTYWIETGNYNAQIEAYRQEVLAYDNRISANSNAIASNDNDISTLKTSITNEANARTSADTALGNRITNIEGELAEITVRPSMYSYFYGFKMVVIGDSYSYGTGASDHLSGDTNRFSSRLATMLGAEELNFAVGSTGFCDPGSGGQNKPFATQISDAIDSMSTSDRSLVHLVLISGGLNDYNEGNKYSASDMSTAAATCASRAINGFPNALIVFVPMLFKGFDANPRLEHFENSIIDGVNGATGHQRCVYIKGAWTWNFGMSSHYANDKLHPNDLGHRVISNKIYANITGGEVYENRLGTIAFEEGFSANVEQGGYVLFHNGIIQSFGTKLQLSNALAANTLTRIGTIPNIAVPLVNVTGIISKGNQNVGVYIITSNGVLYVRATSEVSPVDLFMQPISYLPCGKI